MTRTYSGYTNQESHRRLENERSLGDLFSDLSQKASMLARQEVQLAKVEMKEKAAEASSEIAKIAIGAILANAALLTLIAAIILALSMFMEAWIAALIVAIVVALIAGLLVMNGINGLKELDPVPEQTVATLKEDKEWLTRQIN